MPENQSKVKHPFLASAGLGAAAAVGTYALMRKGKPATKIIQAYEGKGLSTLDKLRKNLYYGKEVQAVPISKLHKALKQEKGPVKVLIEGDQKYIAKHLKARPKQGVTFIGKEKTIDTIFQDKLRFGQLKHRAILPTQEFTKHVGKKQFANVHELGKHLAQQKGDWYYKPRVEFASGATTHISSGEIRKALEQKTKMPSAMHKLVKHPEKYIVQPALKESGTEYRAHIHVVGGKAKPIGSAINRWSYLPTGSNKAHAVTHKAARTFNEIVKSNPHLAKKLKKSNMILGADIVVHPSGKVHIHEFNDQSGFFDRVVAPKLVKKITKMTTPYEAGKQALVAGGLATGITAAGSKAMQQK